MAGFHDPQGLPILSLPPANMIATNLPIEIFLRIANYLDAEDIFSLRSTCHQIDRYLWNLIVQKYFVHLSVRLNPRSLANLLDISRTPHIAPLVENLTFERPSNRDRQRYANGMHVESEPFYFTCFAAQDIVSEALRSFVNLGYVGVDLSTNHDFVDFIHSSWPIHFDLALYSLARSGVAVPALDITFHGGSGGGIPINALSGIFHQSIMGPFLSKLETLWLSVDPNTDNMDRAAPDLVSAIKQSPNIKHLRLNLDRSHPNHCTVLLRHFNTVSLDLSHLSHLDLGKLVVPPHILLHFIDKLAPSLTHLELFRIGLVPSADASDDKILYPWRHLFLSLAANRRLTNLRHVKVALLTQYPWSMHVRFSAPDIRDRWKAATPEREYSGIDPQHFLVDIAKECVIPPDITATSISLRLRHAHYPAILHDQDDDEEDESE